MPNIGSLGWAYVTGSTVAHTGAADQRVTFYSGSAAISGSHNLTYDYANSNLYLSGNLDVSGTINSYKFQTITVSDTIYQGSNSFGNDGSDKHDFSGSIYVTGSANGRSNLTGITIETADVSTVLSASAHEGVFTIDSSGDIVLNADGGNIIFKDDTTTLADITTTSFSSSLGSTMLGPVILSNSNSLTTSGSITTAGVISSSAGAVVGGATFISNTLNVSGATLVAGALTVGDGDAEDQKIVLDGSTNDFYIGIDDTDNHFKLGLGSTVGTNTALSISSTGLAQFPLAAGIAVSGSATLGDAHSDVHSITGSVFLTGSGGGATGLTGITIETAKVSTVLSASATESTFTVDCDGDIELNADGGNITFKDASATLADLTTTSFSSSLGSTMLGPVILSNPTSLATSGSITTAGVLSSSAGAIIGGTVLLSNATSLAASGSVSGSAGGHFKTLGVSGSATLTGLLSSSAGANIRGTVLLSHPTSLAASGSVSGSAGGHFKTLGVSGSATLTGVLSSSAGAVLGGHTFISNALNVTGSTTLASTLSSSAGAVLGGATFISNALNVTGSTILASTLSSSAGAVIGGATFVSNNLSVSGSVTLGDAAADVITVTGQLTGSQGATFSSHVVPSSDNSHNLGQPDKRWANIYTGDLHLRNERGDWTILEEPDYLCVINNATGKRYKMMLQEIED